MQPHLQPVNLGKKILPMRSLWLLQFKKSVKPQADLAWKSRQFDLSKLVSCLKQTFFLKTTFLDDLQFQAKDRELGLLCCNIFWNWQKSFQENFFFWMNIYSWSQATGLDHWGPCLARQVDPLCHVQFVWRKITGSTVDRSDPAKIPLWSMSTERQQLNHLDFSDTKFCLDMPVAANVFILDLFVYALNICRSAGAFTLNWCGDVCFFFSGAIDPCCCQRFGVRVNLFGLVKAECMDIPNHCVRSGPSRAVLESQGISTWCFIALHCACCDHQNYMHHVKHGVTSRSDLKNAWHAMTCHDSHDVKSPQADNTFCSHQLASSKSTRSGEPDFSRWFCLELLHTFTYFYYYKKKKVAWHVIHPHILYLSCNILFA